MRNVFWRHNHRYHHKFMQYKGRPNRIKWKMELRRWRHSIFHFSFSIFHSQWKMESIWRRMHFRFSDISRKWKMDYWCHRFNIFAWMKNEKWNCDGGATQFFIFHFPFFTHDEKWNRYEDASIFDFLISTENEKWIIDVIVLIFLREWKMKNGKWKLIFHFSFDDYKWKIKITVCTRTKHAV